MNRRIGFEFRKLSILFKRNLDNSDVFKENKDLTGLQSYIIGYIYKNSSIKDIYQKDIESTLTIRRSTATEILKLMEKRELIIKTPVANDARLKKITLTQKAIDIHKQVMNAIDKLEENMMSKLTSEELKLFFEIVDKLSIGLEER